uniref:Uncharacterized protein n=1 Tax=Mycena chlorophos TaxID=658473 RepID=A0ABQ0M064_MYCCL|nr:predicted protein [Mycena chlorophos]
MKQTERKQQPRSTYGYALPRLCANERVNAYGPRLQNEVEDFLFLRRTAPSSLNSPRELCRSMGGGGLFEVLREDGQALRKHPQHVGFSRAPTVLLQPLPLFSKLVQYEGDVDAMLCRPRFCILLRQLRLRRIQHTCGHRHPLPQSINQTPYSLTTRLRPGLVQKSGISHMSHGPDFGWTQLDNPWSYESETSHPAVPHLGLALCGGSPDISPPSSKEDALKRFARFGREMSPGLVCGRAALAPRLWHGNTSGNMALLMQQTIVAQTTASLGAHIAQIVDPTAVFALSPPNAPTVECACSRSQA